MIARGRDVIVRIANRHEAPGQPIMSETRERRCGNRKADHKNEKVVKVARHQPSAKRRGEDHEGKLPALRQGKRHVLGRMII